ncbi:MAG TPA: PilZ domain-containing protein [Chthonomonadaceae bacterium]|nr:PilZ domain-containing protein [Chthonomonadaceae bacterium]
MTEITDAELEGLMAHCAFSSQPQASQTLEQAEKRQARRWHLGDQYATLYWLGHEYCVEVCDVSITGMRIGHIPEALQSGSRAILITLLAEYGSMAVNVEVMHVFFRGGERQAGLRFLLHSPHEINPLIRYLENVSEGVEEIKV